MLANLNQLDVAGGRDDCINSSGVDNVHGDKCKIDVLSLAAKLLLVAMLALIGHHTPTLVPFVPQLESLSRDYTAIKEEGYAVDKRNTATTAGGRKRLKLYNVL